jgi:hypothetical protein
MLGKSALRVRQLSLKLAGERGWHPLCTGVCEQQLTEIQTRLRIRPRRGRWLRLHPVNHPFLYGSAKQGTEIGFVVLL